MPIEYAAALPVLTLRFSDERYSGRFLFRTWKMDAFAPESRVQHNPELMVRFPDSCSVVNDDMQLLGATMEGPFSLRAERMPDLRFLFTYLDAAKNTLFLRYMYDPVLPELVLLDDCTDTGGDAAVEFVARFLPDLLLRQGALELHGVLMEHEGRGIVLTAPSGVGKSTHARLWRNLKGAMILNGDLSACYPKSAAGGRVWTGFGMPWCGTSGEYMNREVQISAIVALERGEENNACRLQGIEAFGAVLPQLQLPFWDKELAASGVDLLTEMLETVPVIRLRCRPDSESVETLRRALWEL